MLNQQKVQLRKFDFIAGFSDKLRQFEKEENKPWYKYGKAVGLQFLLQSVFLPEVWQARLIQRNLSALFSIL